MQGFLFFYNAVEERNFTDVLVVKLTVLIAAVKVALTGLSRPGVISVSDHWPAALVKPAARSSEGRKSHLTSPVCPLSGYVERGACTVPFYVCFLFLHVLMATNTLFSSFCILFFFFSAFCHYLGALHKSYKYYI